MANNNLKNKIKEFDWNVIELDGHNIDELVKAFDKKFINKKPKAVIANTIKGKGIPFIENNNSWHHAVLTQKQYDLAIKELYEN